MKYICSLASYTQMPLDTADYHPMPPNINLDTKLVSFIEDTTKHYVCFGIEMWLSVDNINIHTVSFIDDIAVQVKFLNYISNEDKDIEYPIFWATEEATLQDFLNYAEPLLSSIVFHKQNENNYHDKLFCEEVTLKLWAFNLNKQRYFEEHIPYTISGVVHNCELINLSVKEEQGNRLITIEDWATYSPANKFDFYCHFEFTLLCSDGQTATIVQHIASPNRVKEKFFESAINPVFTLASAPIQIFKRYDLKAIFDSYKFTSEWFYGGGLNEILLKSSVFFQPVEPSTNNHLLAAQLSSLTPHPIHFAGLLVGNPYQEEEPIHSEESILRGKDGGRRHYLALDSEYTPNIFTNYLVAEFFRRFQPIN